MNMKIAMCLMGLVLGVLVPMVAVAGDHDGSKPLVCAVLRGTECIAETQECRTGPPWLLNLPVFIDLDFKNMTAATTRADQDDRLSKIERVTQLNGGLMSIQGAEGDYSWSAVIADSSGSLTLVIAGEDIGFTVFGACTPR